MLYCVSNSIATLYFRPPYPIEAPSPPRASIPEGSLSCLDWPMLSIASSKRMKRFLGKNVVVHRLRGGIFVEFVQMDQRSPQAHAHRVACTTTCLHDWYREYIYIYVQMVFAWDQPTNVLLNYQCQTITSKHRTCGVKGRAKMLIPSFRARFTVICHLM